MRYFISILVFAMIAAFWTEFVTKKVDHGLGLFGVFGLACIGCGRRGIMNLRDIPGLLVV